MVKYWNKHIYLFTVIFLFINSTYNKTNIYYYYFIVTLLYKSQHLWPDCTALKMSSANLELLFLIAIRIFSRDTAIRFVPHIM